MALSRCNDVVISHVFGHVPDGLQTGVHHKGIARPDCAAFAVCGFDPRFALKNVSEFNLVIHRPTKHTCRAVRHARFEPTVHADKMAPGFLLGGAVDDVVLELRVDGGDVLLGEVDELQGEAPVSGVIGRGFRT